MNHTYLKGLTPLRFFAAFFVIISHGQLSLTRLGCGQFAELPFFNRGGDAVEFFYVLSGFLITFLLQKEITQNGSVSIRKFYLRRVFRIWPLYFLIVSVGFICLGLLYPRLTGQRFFDFPLWKGLLLFILFLPNLATSLYATGMLFPLRTIGVEEQYYLFWAPLAKLFRHKIAYLVYFFLVLSYIWYYIVAETKLPWPDATISFLKTQKFYAMATGCLFSLFFYNSAEKYRESFLAGKLMQWLFLGLITGYYLVGSPFPDTSLVHFCMCWLYGLLILSCAALEKPVVDFERKPFVYLGVISYTLYMCHMVVDYILRFTIMKFHFERIGCAIMIPGYLIALVGGAVLVASLCYKYYESYFLRLKEKYA